MATLDVMAVKRLCSHAWRRAASAAALAADVLPFIGMAVVFFASRDNTTGVMLFSAWMFFVYMLSAVARVPFNICVVASRRRSVRMAGAVVSLAAAFTFIYGMAVTRTDYEVRCVEVESERLPASFDGYTVAVISDLHIGTMLRPHKELARIRQICDSLHPDMLAFCGDLVNIRYTEIDDDAAAILASITARDGVFAITGNHDIGVYIRGSLSLPPEVNTQRLMAKEHEMGWHVLDDNTEYIRRGDDSIAVTGVSFSRVLQDNRHSSRIPDTGLERIYASVPDSLFDITLAHIPQLWDDILEKGSADLTLSGHVHAMQMKLPVGKRGVSPARLAYPRWSGLYVEKGRALYINDGIGCVLYPMRIGARPEITLIRLKRPDSPQTE